MARLEKVVIVGGGVGGLTTALALARKGVEVEVHEKYDHPQQVSRLHKSLLSAGAPRRTAGPRNKIRSGARAQTTRITTRARTTDARGGSPAADAGTPNR